MDYIYISNKITETLTMKLRVPIYFYFYQLIGPNRLIKYYLPEIKKCKTKNNKLVLRTKVRFTFFL